MLLREPDGNSTQLYNNGNVPLQQQTHQRSWLDKGNVTNPVSTVGNYQVDSNTNSLSLSYRESQLHAALNNALSFDVAVENSHSCHISGSDDLQRESENHNILSPNHLELTLDLNRPLPLSSASADFSPDEGLFDYEEEDRSYSSSNVSLQEDDEKMFDPSVSDDSCSNDRVIYHIPRGIHNPNYPGFQHLAYTLQEYSLESPNSYENISDLTNIHHDYEDKYIENLEDIERYSGKADLELNNNNYECDDIKCKLSPALNHSQDYRSIYHRESVEQSTQMECHPESSLDLSDKNENIASSFARSEEDDALEKLESCLNGSDSDFVSSDESRECSEIHDFQDDLLELKREIYESIQKPIAETLNNISEVVNNVIRHIVEQHDVDADIWKTPSENVRLQNLIGLSIQKLQEEDKLNISDLSTKSDDTLSINSSDMSENLDVPESDKSSIIIEKIKVNMDDAYMSNVAEELKIMQNEDKSNRPDDTDKEVENINQEKKILIQKIPNLDINFNETTSISYIKDDMSKAEFSFNKPIQMADEDISAQKKTLMESNASKAKIEDCKRRSEPKKIADVSNKSIPSVAKNYQRKGYDKKKGSVDLSGSFDVYNIETAMPLIDLDAIESHLRAAREEERRRRNDREEIRRRLAMGTEHEEYYALGDRPGRKPSLQARLQSGMNLQICFMNETASDTESPSDIELNNHSASPKIHSNNSKYSDDKSISDNSIDLELLAINSKSDKTAGLIRPSSLALNESRSAPTVNFSTQLDFFECQARLQTEARMALAQAKEIAHMQMEMERQRQDKSPITEMLRCSLEKAGIKFFGDRRRVSRQMLTDINVAQLQVIVNELHTQIEYLNETLVELLIARDELHMGQDSMLVDIEDLTRHLGAKDLSCKIVDASEKNLNEKSFLEEKFASNNIRKSMIPSLTMK